MSTDIILPYAGNSVYRGSALSYVRSRWEDLGFNVIVGETDEPFSKARAVHDALKSSTADVIVVHDADSWSDATTRAITAVEENTALWVVPFRTVRRLDEESTRGVYEGADIGGRLLRPVHRMVPGGGICVVRREDYDDAPLDPRFVGWGHEDECWGLALRFVLGPPVIMGDILWHLYHEPADKSHTPEKKYSRYLRNVYTRARRKPSEMETLLDQARQLLKEEPVRE